MLNYILQILGIICPKLLTKILYYRATGHMLNLKEPSDLNEKIHWLKLYGDTSKWTELSDKYRVRQYIESKGLKDILVKLYGKWDNVADICWERLPQKFVMKVNNGCGDVLICKDKDELNIPLVEKKFNKLLNKKFGLSTAQLHYRNISSAVIAEELLEYNHPCAISTSSIIDYKFLCFGGKPMFVLVGTNRCSSSIELSLYDLQWNDLSNNLVYNQHFVKAQQKIPRPTKLNEMIEISRILSEGFPQVRVDLYNINDRVYFGELTFTAAGGFISYFTEDFLKQCGSYIKLP